MEVENRRFPLKIDRNAFPVDMAPATGGFERKTDVIYFYGLPGMGGGLAGSASPFCTKFETYLRWRQLPFVDRSAESRFGPKGKWPWMELNTFAVSDSADMIDLCERFFFSARTSAAAPSAAASYSPAANARNDDGLRPALAHGPREAAVRALCRVLEDGTYFQLVYFRWVDDAGWRAIQAPYFGHMNWMMRSVLIPLFARRSIVAQAHAQGASRHSREWNLRRFEEDLTIAADTLGSRRFLLGDDFSVYDCTLFAFLASFLAPIGGVPMQAATLRHTNLVDYYERIRAELYPDAISVSEIPRVEI